MNIQPLINAIRYKLRYGITVEWYNFWYMAQMPSENNSAGSFH